MKKNAAELVDLTLTNELRTFVVGQGIDLFGVSSADRLSDAPEGFRPQDYLPGARTVISIASAIGDDICDTWGTFEDEGKSPLPYMYYGLGVVYWELARVANVVARRIERKGYRSVIFPPHWSVSHYRSLDAEPTGWPLARVNNAIPQDFPHLAAAVAAGLGEIGWSGLVLTPGFGSRVRFNSIVTDAPLAVDPVYSGEPLCQPERCDRACVRACPASALSSDEGMEVSVAGKSCRCASLDAVRCHYGLDGLVRGSGGRTCAQIPDGPGDPEHYQQTLAQKHPQDIPAGTQRGLLGGNHCERCLLECPAHVWGRTR